MQRRFDTIAGSFDLGRARRDGAGALIVDATPAPADAVLEYATGREFRPASEVFARDSLATWTGIPLIRGHFDVTMTNVDQSIGYVRSARAGRGWVEAVLVVTDAKAIEAIERRELVELSGGYDIEQLHTPGVHDGIPYQTRQSRIRMRHLGMGPVGWARAGAEARVR